MYAFYMDRIGIADQCPFSTGPADQFKTWIKVFSIPALQQILPSDHIEWWRHFVLAWRILCKQSLSITVITLADTLLVQLYTVM